MLRRRDSEIRVASVPEMAVSEPARQRRDVHEAEVTGHGRSGSRSKAWSGRLRPLAYLFGLPIIVWGALVGYGAGLGARGNDAEFRRLGVPLTRDDWGGVRIPAGQPNAADEFRAMKALLRQGKGLDHGRAEDPKVAMRLLELTEAANRDGQLDFGWTYDSPDIPYRDYSGYFANRTGLHTLAIQAAKTNDYALMARLFRAVRGGERVMGSLNTYVPHWMRDVHDHWGHEIARTIMGHSSSPQTLALVERELRTPFTLFKADWKTSFRGGLGDWLLCVRDRTWLQAGLEGRSLPYLDVPRYGDDAEGRIYQAMKRVPGLGPAVLRYQQSRLENALLLTARRLASMEGDPSVGEDEGVREALGLLASQGWRSDVSFDHSARQRRVARSDLTFEALHALKVRNATGAFPASGSEGYRRSADGKGFTIQRELSDHAEPERVDYPPLPEKIKGR